MQEVSSTMQENTKVAPNWRLYQKDTNDGGDSGPNIARYSPTPSTPFDHRLEAGEQGFWSQRHFEEALNLYERLADCDDSYVSHKIDEALKCLDSAYRLYGPRHVIGSYNGGKDAVVILHLMRAAHAKFYHNILNQQTENKEQTGTTNGTSDSKTSCERLRPRVIYFDHKEEFPEIRKLLKSTVTAYDLDMLAFESSFSFLDGLEILVNSAKPMNMGFVLGTRKADPNARDQGQFAPSSSYMPPFMRVNPILDWCYGHVWHFLRLFQLPYCSLYDEGYTSLGNVKDTLPCPALEKPQGGYWPAYMLGDWDQERAGRKTQPNRSTTPKKIEKGKKHKLHESISTLSISSSLEKDRDQGELDPVLETSTTSSSCSTIASTVGLIVIGDEILKGLCRDANMYAAAIAFHSRDLILARVAVVADELDEIVDEIARMRKEVDVVVTSGGVGPTHDDVTMNSVSVALSSPLVFHEEMAEMLKDKMGPQGKKGDGNDGELSEAQIKMATLPRNSKLRYFGKENQWPILQCRNVYVMPGVPQLFESKINALASHLSTNLERTVTCKVVLSVDETKIVVALNSVVKNHQHVTFGSYPFMNHPEFKTVVMVESKEAPSFPGESRSDLRRRSVTSLQCLLEQTQSGSSGSIGQKDVLDENNKKEVSSTTYGIFTRKEMDLNVKLAVDELISKVPEGSVLRVDNDTDLC